jgi:multimeric flavodoxin WrbA
MSGRKLVILMGSPRKEGNSAVMAQRLAEGAAKAGATVDSFYLHAMDIKPCTGCDRCQGEDAGGCVIDDAMQGVYKKLRETDSIVFASPVYWFSVSAQLKTVIDRIYAVGGGDKNVLAGKTLGVLLAYADDDPFTSGAVNALRMFQDISAYLGTAIAGMVYGSAFGAGEIGENEALMKQAYELGQRLGKAPGA